MSPARTTLYLALGTVVVMAVCVVATIGIAFELGRRAALRVLGRGGDDDDVLAGYGEHDTLDPDGSFW